MPNPDDAPSVFNPTVPQIIIRVELPLVAGGGACPCALRCGRHVPA